MKMLLIIVLIVIVIAALAMVLGRSGGPHVTQITRKRERTDDEDPDDA